MDVVVEEKSPVSKQVSVTLPSSSLDRDIDKRLAQLSKRVKIHGFRPGKAPKKLLIKKYGQSVRMDAIDDAVRRTMNDVLDREDLTGTVHVSRPELKQGLLEGEEIVFEFTAERLPELDAKDYEGVDVQMLKVEVADEDVKAELERMQKERVAIVPVEDRDTVEKDDVVIVSYKGIGEGEVAEIHAEDQQIDLADPSLLAGFADGIAGAKVGEAKEVQVELPEEFGLESIAGTTITLEVTVSELKRSEMPDLDDDFAKAEGEFETLAALEQDIRDRLSKNRKKSAEANAKRSLIDKVVAANPTDLPELYVGARAAEEAQMRLRRLAEQGLDLSQLGSDISAFAESMKEDVRTAIHESVVMRAIGKAHEISVSDEDIDAYLAEQAEETGQPLARFKAQFSAPAQRDGLRSRLTYERVVDHVWGAAKIEEVDELPEAKEADDADDSDAE